MPTIDLTPLAKILPVEKIYDDLLARGVRQAGSIFEDLMKNVRIALPGVQLAATDQDRFRKIIEDPYFMVAPELRVLPAAQLVGQVLEGVRYEPIDTPIWQMFNELLQRGCDKNRIGEAHPSFAGIIRQLSPDEALMLRKIQSEACEIFIGHQINYNEILELPISKIGLEFPDLHFREKAIVYANHLEALGLVNDLVAQQRENIENTDQTRLVWSLQLSYFGEMFCGAVMQHRQSFS